MNSEKGGFVETHVEVTHGMLLKSNQIKSNQLDSSWYSEMFEKLEW